MPFTWREYLDLAKALPTQCQHVSSLEATERCSVSRAYYAAFCHARNYARVHLGFVPTNSGSDHRLVRQFYVRRGMPDIAQRLASMHQWRKLCDYNDIVPNTTAMFTNAMREAEYVIRQL